MVAIINVDGPIAPLDQPQSNWNPGIVFSVQLTNGSVATNPEQFGVSAPVANPLSGPGPHGAHIQTTVPLY